MISNKLRRSKLRKSPRKSQRKSPRKSQRKSPRKSQRKSPRKSQRKSPRKSPRKTKLTYSPGYESELSTEIDTKILSDKEIIKLFEKLFPKPTNPTTEIVKTSGCFVLSGHGYEGDISDKKTILNEILLKFNSLVKKEDIIKYIEDSVHLTISMGFPGPSAPMEVENTEGRFSGLTTSETEIEIPRNFFRLFNKYNSDKSIELNDENLRILHFLIRRQLRTNFRIFWGCGGHLLKKGSDWRVQINNLLNRYEIWVLKKVLPGSMDREYSLKPNEGEDPEFRAHEGVHMIDTRHPQMSELVKDIKIILNKQRERISDIKPGEFDKNNLQKSNARQRLELAFQNILLTKDLIQTRSRKIQKAFNSILDDIEHNQIVYLSQIIMLGYLLGIEKLYIYDPACRPLSDSDVPAMAAKIHREGKLPAIERVCSKEETFERVPSAPL